MKKAIIIGATSGIGEQLALLLAEKNFLIGATGRRRELLESLQSKKPDNIIISDFDVTHSFEVSKQLEALLQKLGGLDLLIISSGVGDYNKSLDFAIEKKTIDVNVAGFTEAAGWAFNVFAKQKAGHLVGITSIAGIRGSRHGPAYNASKAYQINYLEGLRQKASKSGMPIFVSDIRPGFVKTDMVKGGGVFWMSSVEKASKQILTAIEKRKPVAYITKRWRLVAALLKILPGSLYKKA